MQVYSPTGAILVIGATGQIGSELVPALRVRYGADRVIAVGHKTKPSEELFSGGPFEIVDAGSKEAVRAVVQKYNVKVIYHLASLLSANGEKNPDLAWEVNANGLKIVLDLAKEEKVERIFWPSSIAAFGPDTPKDQTPNETILRPTTMYGVTKVAGELLCEYYVKRYGLDVRSLRYPGIISYKTLPGGGTTDYAVAIFYEAIKQKKYTCFLKADTVLPMMFMPDCIKATVEVMEAEPATLQHRVFNLAAVSFSPRDVVAEIKQHIPEFECAYTPDFRQAIADSWPRTIDDSIARVEWGWRHEYDLEKMVKVMLAEIRKKS